MILADCRGLPQKKLFQTKACNHLPGSVSSPCTLCAEPLADLSAAQQVDPTDKPNREPGLIPADCHADHVSDHMTRASGAHFLFSMGVNSVCSAQLTEVFLRADLYSFSDFSNCREFAVTKPNKGISPTTLFHVNTATGCP
jgi:hypothetical protein